MIACHINLLVDIATVNVAAVNIATLALKTAQMPEP